MSRVISSPSVIYSKTYPNVGHLFLDPAVELILLIKANLCVSGWEGWGSRICAFTTHQRVRQCTLHDFWCYYSGLVADSLTHWLNPTISARLIFAWQAHVNMFELFKDITSEMFPSTWLSTGYRRKNTGWNKADYYNNKQNLLCLFKGPCLSHNSVFILPSCLRQARILDLFWNLPESFTFFSRVVGAQISCNCLLS